jgi:hypothetical protein
MERVRARLVSRAIPFRPEQHRDHHSLYISDPDGVVVEVMVPVV